MSESHGFRIVNEFEKSIISNTLSKILHDTNILLKIPQYKLYISFNGTSSEGQNPLIFLISSAQHNLIRKFDPNMQITSIGLYFGFFKEDNFRLSLEGVEFLANNANLPKDQKLIIDGKGEKSVLYGNYIRKGNVIRFPEVLQKGDFLVIYNIKNEICAIGQSLINKQDLINLKLEDKIALNLVDKGYYLRKKQ